MILADMILEVASRLGDFIPSRPTASGLQTTVIDRSLIQYWPNAIPQLNAWVYCQASAHAHNVGTERRIAQWDPNSFTAILHSPGFIDTTVAGDTLEIHKRWPRSRKLAAINDAIGQLSIGWYREVIVEEGGEPPVALTANGWTLNLPGEVPWKTVDRVEMEQGSSVPYIPVIGFEWRKGVDARGAAVSHLQFREFLPVGRKIRIIGTAYYTRLKNDFDVLPLEGDWEGQALAWIYDWAIYRLEEEAAFQDPAGQSQPFDAKRLAMLQKSREDIVTNKRPLGNARVVVPDLYSRVPGGFLGHMKVDP